MDSSLILFDPWLKRCDDGDLALRCESPNTDLFLTDFVARCSTASQTSIEQIREWGNACYHDADHLGALEFYTFALDQPTSTETLSR